MKITIVTVGTRGDVEPFVALGCGLQKAGHTVKIATHAAFESFVREYDLDFALISGSVQEAINSTEARETLEKNKTTFAFIMKVRQKAAPLVLTAVKELAEACKGSDHLMCTPLTMYITFFIAQEFSIPLSVGCVSPAGPTRDFHSIIVPPPFAWLPGFAKRAYNFSSHRIMGNLVWQGQRPLLNAAWREVFGHGLPLREPLTAAFTKTPPLMFYAYSKHVLAKPADWSKVQCVTGYWFLKPSHYWKPDAGLEKFLQSGSKPVYIGYGSMNDGQNKNGKIKDLILETVRRAGQRAVVLNADLGWAQNELPENIFVTEPVPFEFLFPKMAAVIHHGGAGTTAAGLRAGVPSVITPLIYDQRFWAWCVENIGAGTKPVAWSRLTPDNLSASISSALTSTDIKNKARLASERINQEDGVAKAVELFNTYYC